MASTSKMNWLDQVLKADKDHYKPDVVYKFSNKRIFHNTDKSWRGLYNPYGAKFKDREFADWQGREYAEWIE